MRDRGYDVRQGDAGRTVERGERKAAMDTGLGILTSYIHIYTHATRRRVPREVLKRVEEETEEDGWRKSELPDSVALSCQQLSAVLGVADRTTPEHVSMPKPAKRRFLATIHMDPCV